MGEAEPSDDKSRDRRKEILRAAVEVFADRGFHRTRVSDIAREAGVAYGLIYHYFRSKEELLNSVFQENWAVFLQVLRGLADDPDMPTADKLRAIGDNLINALGVVPKTIQVIIQEISRSDRYVHPQKMEAFQEAFSAVRQIIEEGQARGEIRAELHPQVAAHALFGALEMVCTGAMIGQISCETDEERSRVRTSLGECLLSGLMVGGD